MNYLFCFGPEPVKSATKQQQKKQKQAKFQNKKKHKIKHKQHITDEIQSKRNRDPR